MTLSLRHKAVSCLSANFVLILLSLSLFSLQAQSPLAPPGEDKNESPAKITQDWQLEDLANLNSVLEHCISDNGQEIVYSLASRQGAGKQQLIRQGSMGQT